MLYRKKGLRGHWYYYLLLAFVDVEGNYLVVKAYQYTSITSVMLLDCWTIPCVLLLTWIFLKTKYKIGQFIGVAVCVGGLVLVVFSDVHASDRERGSNPIRGDMLVIGGSMLYAISNVSEEFCVKNVDRVELMAMLGSFGAVVSACQVSIFERHELKSIHWNAHAVLPFVGFAVALFCFYTLVPILLKISGSAMLNLSLLTSDMWAVVIRIFAYHEKVDWMYFLSFGAVAVGLIIYSSITDEPTVAYKPKEDAEPNNIWYKRVDVEANLGNCVQEEELKLEAPRETDGNGQSSTTNTLEDVVVDNRKQDTTDKHEN
eukprot:Gb_22149 [translate_table: standard]